MTTLAAPLHSVAGQPIDYAPNNYATVYWAVWSVLMGVGFLVFEFWQIATGHPENTLSAQVWRMAHVVAGQAPAQWAIEHWVFAVLFGLLASWLTVHFDLGWLR